MSAKIYLSYGIPKSASSFVCQMYINAAKIHADVYNKKIYNLFELIDHSSNELFIDVALKTGSRDELSDLIHASLSRMNSRSDNGILVIKTHTGCSESLQKLIREGTVIASATYRHPVDMILSRMDMATRDLENIKEFDFLNYYNLVILEFETWADQVDVPKFYYDDIVLAPHLIAKEILRQFSLEIDPSIILDPLLKNKKDIWQFNKGIINRRYAEMSDQEIQHLSNSFEKFIAYIDSQKKLSNSVIS